MHGEAQRWLPSQGSQGSVIITGHAHTLWRFGSLERTPTCTSRLLFCSKRDILIVSLSGGGNELNIKMDRGRPPLRWMALEAQAAGLKIEEFVSELHLDQLINPQESLRGLWWLLEYIPVRRLAFSGPKALTRT